MSNGSRDGVGVWPLPPGWPPLRRRRRSRRNRLRSRKRSRLRSRKQSRPKERPAAPAEQGPAAPPAAPEAAEPPATAADLAALKAEIQALREAAEAQKGALDAVSAELAVEREQRAEEVISLQAKGGEGARSSRGGGALQRLRPGGRQPVEPGVARRAQSEQRQPDQRRAIPDPPRAPQARRSNANTPRAGWNSTATRSTAPPPALSAPKRPPRSRETRAPAGRQLIIGLFKIPFGFEVTAERPRPPVHGAFKRRARPLPRRV